MWIFFNGIAVDTALNLLIDMETCTGVGCTSTRTISEHGTEIPPPIMPDSGAGMCHEVRHEYD